MTSGLNTGILQHFDSGVGIIGLQDPVTLVFCRWKLEELIDVANGQPVRIQKEALLRFLTFQKKVDMVFWSL